MRGRPLKLSIPRRFVADLCWITKRVPLGVITGRINVGTLVAARRAATSSLPYTALFAKAFAKVANEFPELRRTYVPWPWPHLYEVPDSVAAIMIERDIEGERSIFPVKIKAPAKRELTQIAAEIEHFRTAPIEAVPHLKRIMRISRLPLIIRRALWVIAFNSGRQRPNYFGTFGISALGQHGVKIGFPVSPITSFISYGPIGPDGSVDVTMGFDHRTFDGALVAKALAALEKALNGEIVRELADGKPEIKRASIDASSQGRPSG